MFGRRPRSEEPAEPAEERPAGGKGRPTPKRSESEARRRQPLVVNDRREASRRSREERRREQAKLLEAYETENQLYLPERDRGPVRRFVRDLVDGRRNIGEYFLPIALVILVLGVIPIELFVLVSAVSLYTLLGVLVLDSFLLGRTVTAAVRERFGDDAARERGLRWYAILRAFQMRRTRRPRVKVKHGEQPR